jgi:hypothetical protein
MSRHSPVRTLLSGGLAAGLLAAGVIVASAAASSPNLPPVAPDRLIASALAAMQRDPRVSGRVATHIEVGLPQLPTFGQEGGSGLASLLSAISGDHVLRVWRSDAGLRLSESLPFAERSLIITPTDAWAWDSGRYTAYHIGPFPSAVNFSGPGALGPAEMLDPMSLAGRVLEAIDPSTEVSMGRSARVAGRASYVLVLTPRTDQTLIGRVEIGIDAARRLPLRVAVFARDGESPAASVGYSSIGFGQVDPAVFRFSPPPEARVVPAQDVFSQGHDGSKVAPLEPGEGYAGFPGAPIRTFGHGWAGIVALRTPPLANRLGEAAGADLGSFLPFSGPLFSIRLVTRGDHDWVLYGFVPQSALAAVERELS